MSRKVLILALALAFITLRAFLHNNNIQNFQVIQSVTGSIEVRSDGGYFPAAGGGHAAETGLCGNRHTGRERHDS